MPSRCACTFRSNVTYPSQLVWRLDNGYRHQDNDTLRWKWKCAGLVIMHIRFHLVFPGAPIIYGCSLSKQLTGCAGQRGKRKDKNRAKKQLWQGSVKNTWAKQKHNSSMGEKTVKESQRVWSIWKCCQMSGMEVFFRAPRLGLTSLPSKICEAAKLWAGKSGAAFFFEGWQCRHAKPPKGLGTWKRESCHGKEMTAHDWKKKPSWPSVASSAVTFCCHCQKTRNFIFSKDQIENLCKWRECRGSNGEMKNKTKIWKGNKHF